MIELDLDDLLASVDVNLIYPDGESLAEPITSCLGITENQVQEKWKSSGRTWRDSLRIVNSIKCDSSIPPEILRCVDYMPPRIEPMSCVQSP